MNGAAVNTYAYDLNGNRLSLDEPGTANDEVYAYDAASNHLLKDTTGIGKTADADAYKYDATGNTLTDGDYTFTYDARGRMSSVVTNENNRHLGDLFGFFTNWANHKNEINTTQYLINGLDQRLAKTNPLSSTIFVYDEAGHILGEYDARGDVMEETVYLGDTPIAVLGGGSPSDWGPLFNLLALFNSQVVHYITPDNLGAPHTITDGNGKKVWEWHHTPFGDSQPQELGFSYNLRFPGQINDPESGLYYNMFRDYNPNTGRYM